MEIFFTNTIPVRTLPFPKFTSRKKEVLLMSLMYKNNLLNSSLYKLDKVLSPLCSLCQSEEETLDHILLSCENVQVVLKQRVIDSFKIATCREDDIDPSIDFIDLLNASRNQNFITSCLNFIMSFKYLIFYLDVLL